jgi:hypothetical protein
MGIPGKGNSMVGDDRENQKMRASLNAEEVSGYQEIRGKASKKEDC